jgi:DNA-binding LacI/PurR family transcriptional regulator
MARLLDVARLAGVSRSTVSNVFSKPGRVSPDIRTRVEEAALALGYAGPDPTGRALRGGKVNAVGVLCGLSLEGTFNWSYFVSFLGGAASVCDERHAALVIVSGLDKEAATLGMRTALVDGFILHNSEHLDILLPLAAHRGFPVVAVDMATPPGFNSIRLDNRGGVGEAVRHLVELGHRRFGILSLVIPERGIDRPIFHGPASSPRTLVEPFVDTQERYAGYAEALTAAGIAFDEVPVVETLPDGAEEGAAMLLDHAPGITAVLAMADVLALGMLKEAKRRGIDVPRDLSVIGFDDLPIAALSDPPLTTVSQPVREKGRLAAEMIFEPPAESRHVLMPLSLAVRNSTGPARR